MRNLTRPDTQEISFQHFKTQLLAKDVVDRIEVANKTTAKVLPHYDHDFLDLLGQQLHAFAVLSQVVASNVHFKCHSMFTYHRQLQGASARCVWVTNAAKTALIVSAHTFASVSCKRHLTLSHRCLCGLAESLAPQAICPHQKTTSSQCQPHQGQHGAQPAYTSIAST